MLPGSDTSQHKQCHYSHPINCEAHEHNPYRQCILFSGLHWYIKCSYINIYSSVFLLYIKKWLQWLRDLTIPIPIEIVSKLL